MSIKMINPNDANEPFLKELEDAATSVIRSGSYILGPEVAVFEKQMADYLGVRYAIGVSSGTDALLAALMAYGIGPGDEVICPSFTFFATAGSIARSGATPVFVDILKDCFTIDPQAIRAAITKKTKAIMPVHLFGQSSDMDAIMSIASEHDLIVIEDACQAIGASVDSSMIGAIGNVGCFSFFPTKNLGGFGDSGLIVTNEDSTAERLIAARNHGSKVRYFHDFVGGNFRIDTIQAALLSVKLKYLPEQEAARRRHAQIYADVFKDLGLNEEVISPPKEVRGRHVYNQYTIRIHNNKRSALFEHLSAHGISSAIYYPLPLHQQACFTSRNSASHTMNETELAASEVLSLPISSEVADEDIAVVASEIVAFSRQQF
jgi:dTDP-4-amino-4,6-dideoxygalactose transaminase